MDRSGADLYSSAHVRDDTVCCCVRVAVHDIVVLDQSRECGHKYPSAVDVSHAPYAVPCVSHRDPV